MRTHTVRALVTLCAAVALAGAMGTSSAAPPAARAVKQQPARTVIVDCFWNPNVRPADFILACGDGNSRLSSLEWSHWGLNSATAKGFNLVNDCKPYCAAGKFHSYAVVVRLDHPQPWKKHPQVQRYTQMSLVYTANRPDGFERTVTYPLWN
ncbi:hypothetical protein [Streptomyces avermitilis]|uniref:hypothetical protein n=1 Tax=Streptomyces avermitilis TaxID=33903 RepID=UPI003820927B